MFNRGEDRRDSRSTSVSSMVDNRRAGFQVPEAEDVASLLVYRWAEATWSYGSKYKMWIYIYLGCKSRLYRLPSCYFHQWHFMISLMNMERNHTCKLYENKFSSFFSWNVKALDLSEDVRFIFVLSVTWQTQTTSSWIPWQQRSQVMMVRGWHRQLLTRKYQETITALNQKLS